MACISRVNVTQIDVINSTSLHLVVFSQRKDLFDTAAMNRFHTQSCALSSYGPGPPSSRGGSNTPSKTTSFQAVDVVLVIRV